MRRELPLELPREINNNGGDSVIRSRIDSILSKIGGDFTAAHINAKTKREKYLSQISDTMGILTLYASIDEDANRMYLYPNKDCATGFASEPDALAAITQATQIKIQTGSYEYAGLFAVGYTVVKKPRESEIHIYVPQPAASTNDEIPLSYRDGIVVVDKK